MSEINGTPYQFFVRGLSQDEEGRDIDTPIDHFYWASEGDVPFVVLDCVAEEYLVTSGNFNNDRPVQEFSKVSDALIAFAAILKKKGF